MRFPNRTSGVYVFLDDSETSTVIAYHKLNPLYMVLIYKNSMATVHLSSFDHSSRFCARGCDSLLGTRVESYTTMLVGHIVVLFSECVECDTCNIILCISNVRISKKIHFHITSGVRLDVT